MADKDERKLAGLAKRLLATPPKPRKPIGMKAKAAKAKKKPGG